jgi:hypothetical protein
MCCITSEAVVVICIYKLHECPINAVTNPKTVYRHSITWLQDVIPQPILSRKPHGSYSHRFRSSGYLKCIVNWKSCYLGEEGIIGKRNILLEKIKHWIILAVWYPAQQEAGSKPSFSLLPASSWFLAWFIFQPWIWRQYIPPKRRQTFNGIHLVILQKI